MACRLCSAVVSRRCGSSRVSVCAPCAHSYKGRVARLAASGTRGLSRGASIRKGQRGVFSRTGLFVTLTAPGADVHYITGRGGVRRICLCTPLRSDPTGWIAEWNAGMSQRWRMVIQRIRRDHGKDVQYFRAVEAQDRGALHYHVIFRRADGTPLRLSKAYIRAVAVGLGFGHEVDVQPYDEKVAGYVAKYVSKAADERPDVPWDGTRERVREYWPGVPWRVQERRFTERTTEANYRTWVASRRYGDRMSQVRLDQAHWGRIWWELPAWAESDGSGGWLPLPQDDRFWLDDVPDRPDGPDPTPGL